MILKHIQVKKGNSLLFLNTAKIIGDLQKEKKFLVLKVEKQYPSKLKIVVEEKESLFIIKNKDRFFEIGGNGEVLSEGNQVVDFDKFYIEWNTEVLGEMNEQSFKKVFFNLYNKLPENERDITNVYSGIYLGKENKLYAKNEPVEALLACPLTLESLRKARYAYLYRKIKKIEADMIDLRFDFTKFSKKGS